VPATFDSADLRAIVLVEGISDQVALETLARRRGLNLDAKHISVEAIGGAQAVGRFLTRLVEQRTDVRLAGLCDVVLAQQAGGRALEDRELADALVVEVFRLEADDVAVLVLHDEQHVEHADDPALDEVDQQRHRLARHGRAGRITDHGDVDRAQFLVAFHSGASKSRNGGPTLGSRTRAGQGCADDSEVRETTPARSAPDTPHK